MKSWEGTFYIVLGGFSFFTVFVCVDSMDGFSLQKSAPRISLLELMRTTEGGRVQTAESTAQRLLQFIATQYSGVDTEDMGTSTTVSGIE